MSKKRPEFYLNRVAAIPLPIEWLAGWAAVELACESAWFVSDAELDCEFICRLAAAAACCCWLKAIEEVARPKGAEVLTP